MAIKGNVGLGVVDIGVTDTTLLNPSAPVERVSVGAFSVHNDGSAGGNVTVEIFISPNATSASGKRVAYYVIRDNESVDINELIGEGLADTQFLIAKADVTGANAHVTVTEYDSGS